MRSPSRRTSSACGGCASLAAPATTTCSRTRITTPCVGRAHPDERDEHPAQNRASRGHRRLAGADGVFDAALDGAHQRSSGLASAADCALCWATTPTGRWRTTTWRDTAPTGAEATRDARLLLESTRGWAAFPPNAKIAATSATKPLEARGPWWQGRDLRADRRSAEQIARGAPRVCSSCQRCDSAYRATLGSVLRASRSLPVKNPNKRLLEAFAISLTKDSTAIRSHSLRYLADYFAALPSTDFNEIAEIGRQISAAVRLWGMRSLPRTARRDGPVRGAARS